MKLALLIVCLLFCFHADYCDELENRLEKLSRFYEKGLITKEEYTSSKRELLENFSTAVATPARNSQALQAPDGNIIAVIPFYGKVYSDGDRDTIAKFTVDNCRRYLENKRITLEGGILDYYQSKNLLASQLGSIDPGQAYSQEFLQNAADILKVRYLFFGNILHYAYDSDIYRFNVECLVYDRIENKIIYKKSARQSEARKVFNAYIKREKGKTIGKITEQFYPFLNSLATQKSKLAR